MKYYRLFAFILVILSGLILSCSSNSNNEKTSSNETTETAGGSTSGIIDQSCSLDPNIKFSYYLPKS
ncbi:MAG: hypothetical protein ACK44N_11465, partial [Bacteroidota bacterium]